MSTSMFRASLSVTSGYIVVVLIAASRFVLFPICCLISFTVAVSLQDGNTDFRRNSLPSCFFVKLRKLPWRGQLAGPIVIGDFMHRCSLL
jgi:hypothetical protein